jgi:light-regulated signal transduction histidine kinase (bacteriophytochrome)
MDQQKLHSDLDRAYYAAESFIVNYSVRMQQPVDFVSTLVTSLKKSEDRIINQAHLETLQRTLLQMEKILNELTNTLSAASGLGNESSTK